MAVALTGEFLVNTNTPGAQSRPAVAGLSNGNFVVAWESPENGGDVKAQLFDLNGSRVGGEFRVSAASAGQQVSPAVAALDTGGFVVAWNGDFDVKAQSFTTSGQRVGPEYTIDLPDYSPTAGFQEVLALYSPEVADLAGDGYVLSWALNFQFGSDFNAQGYRAQAQLVNDNATSRGGRISLDRFPQGGRVDVAGLGNGGFILAYGKVYDIGDREHFTDISVYDREANLLNTVRMATFYDFDIAALPLNDFTLVSSRTFRLQDPLLFTGIFGNDGRVLRSVGTQQGYFGHNPAVAAFGGSLMMAFRTPDRQFGFPEPDIRVTAFRSSTLIYSAEVTVNTTTQGAQTEPDVAFLPNGRAVVVWKDASGVGGDASETSIKARLFTFDSPL